MRRRRTSRSTTAVSCCAPATVGWPASAAPRRTGRRPFAATSRGTPRAATTCSTRRRRLHGFTLQAAVAEDNFWDVALRYAGEFNGVRIAFGIGYMEDSEFNAAGPVRCRLSGRPLRTRDCDVKVTDFKGAASVLHVPTGLFLTGACGSRELDGIDVPAAARYTGPDLTFWYIRRCLRKNFFGIGNTVLFAEYGETEGGLAQANFLGTSSAHAQLDGSALQQRGHQLGHRRDPVHRRRCHGSVHRPTRTTRSSERLHGWQHCAEQQRCRTSRRSSSAPGSSSDPPLTIHCTPERPPCYSGA